MNARTLALLAAALVAAGCPGPDDDPPPPPACTGTYSGALTGTFTCNVSALYDGSGTTIEIYAPSLTGDALDLIPLETGWTGALAPATYTEGTSGITSYSAVFASTSTYYATRNAVLPDFGTFTLTISSAAPVGAGPEWEIHGTFDATMAVSPADPGAANVTLTMTF
jgi:hypothetical protein